MVLYLAKGITLWIDWVERNVVPIVLQIVIQIVHLRNTTQHGSGEKLLSMFPVLWIHQDFAKHVLHLIPAAFRFQTFSVKVLDEFSMRAVRFVLNCMRQPHAATTRRQRLNDLHTPTPITRIAQRWIEFGCATHIWKRCDQRSIALNDKRGVQHIVFKTENQIIQIVRLDVLHAHNLRVLRWDQNCGL